jgi:hypothetical protein
MLFKETKLSLYVHILVIADNTKVLQAFCFLRLPYCLSKMCPVVPRHKLVLPIHTFGSCYASSALVMNSEPITSPKLAGHGSKVCLGIIHLFGEKKRWIGQRAYKGKNNNNHHHVHIYRRTLGHFNTSPSNN